MNLARAAEFLKSKKQRIEAASADSFVLDTGDTFGMVMGFTNRAIPNDPR